MIQFAPARAKKKIAGPHELAEVAGFSTEQKIDGQRYIIQTRDGGGNCTSRRTSVQTQRYVEKGDRVPHLMNLPLPAFTMLDCEFAASGDIVLCPLPDEYWDKMMPHPHTDWLREKFNGELPVYPHVSETTAIMGSDAPEAIRKQKERGPIWAYAFDIVQFANQSTTKSTQAQRRSFLAKQLMSLDPEDGLVLMPSWYNLRGPEQQELFDIITDYKGEGLIFKDLTRPYNHAKNWFKWKIDYPVDVVLTGGYTMGNEGKTGKMLGLVGNVEIGVYNDEGELCPVGFISAIMDSEAGLPELTRRAYEGELAGEVLECRHNGIQKKPGSPLGYTLRHPRFRRRRNDDKSPEDCTSARLLAEIK